MSPDELSILSPASKIRKLLPLFLGGLGIAMMVFGISYNYIKSNQKVTAVEKEMVESASVAGIISSHMIQVDISGAVEKPGVYEIPADSRVKDVLIAAGGLVPKADRTYISKTINLAQRVQDGGKVYFPYINETSLPAEEAGNVSHLININTASASELDTLPGVGPVTSGKIIAGRPYQNISDLQSKKIVSASVYAKLKEKISVN